MANCGGVTGLDAPRQSRFSVGEAAEYTLAEDDGGARQPGLPQRT